jgi:hypothetical protein
MNPIFNVTPVLATRQSSLNELSVVIIEEETQPGVYIFDIPSDVYVSEFLNYLYWIWWADDAPFYYGDYTEFYPSVYPIRCPAYFNRGIYVASDKTGNSEGPTTLEVVYYKFGNNSALGGDFIPLLETGPGVVIDSVTCSPDGSSIAVVGFNANDISPEVMHVWYSTDFGESFENYSINGQYGNSSNPSVKKYKLLLTNNSIWIVSGLEEDWYYSALSLITQSTLTTIVDSPEVQVILDPLIFNSAESTGMYGTYPIGSHFTNGIVFLSENAPMIQTVSAPFNSNNPDFPMFQGNERESVWVFQGMNATFFANYVDFTDSRCSLIALTPDDMGYFEWRVDYYGSLPTDSYDYYSSEYGYSPANMDVPYAVGDDNRLIHRFFNVRRLNDYPGEGVVAESSTGHIFEMPPFEFSGLFLGGLGTIVGKP